MNNYNTCAECNKEFTGRKKKYCSKECSDEVRRRKNRERMRKVNPPKSDVTIICEWCGELHTVPARTAHQAKYCSKECQQTHYSRTVRGYGSIHERRKEWEKQRLIRQRELEYKRTMRSLAFAIKLIHDKKEEEQRIKELTRNCEECGKEFYDPNPVPLTCSRRCSRRRRNRLQRLYMNERYNDDNLIDTDITLKKLYNRDEGVCYICNKECNYDDVTITGEGHYIVGETYPSIDHVIPIAKGGKHSWNNVKLAHHRCNTLKRDNLIDSEKALV